MDAKRPEDWEEKTIGYYDQHVETFTALTLHVDMGSLYQSFLSHLPKDAHILDAGCGVGRDSKYFLEQGFQVTAIDASVEMVNTASRITGQQAHQKTFLELEYKEKFEGIWACASLLHLPKHELPEVLKKLLNALRKQGILYASFKRGTREGVYNDRFFADFEANELQKQFEHFSHIQILKTWETLDSRPERPGEYWVNILVQKVA